MSIFSISSSHSKSLMLSANAMVSVAVLFLLGSSLAHANAPATAPAKPSDKKGISIGINAMMTQSPYDMKEADIAILPSVLYDNDKVYVRGSQLGGYVYKDASNEVAAFFQPAGFTFDPDDANDALQGLNEREWSGMAGVSYQRRIPYGAVRAQVATDVVGNSEGTTAKLAYMTRLKKGNLTLYPSIGVEWADDTYNDYYYGISAKESAKTGLKAYTADASISPYINISANYDMNEDWSLYLGQNVGYLSDEQYDSPMVDNRTTYRTTIGLVRQF